MEPKKWSSGVIFVLAAVGSAVGLGNMWRFPYVAGVSGGSAFVLVYIAALLLFIMPILVAEFVIGRMGRSSSMESIANVAEAESKSRHWGYVGLLGTAASYLIMTFYTIVAGWSLAYLLRMLRGDLADATADQSAAVFEQFMANPAELTLWHGVFTFATVAIAIRGLHKGLESAFRKMMPVLFLLLIVLVINGLTLDGAGEALRFLFSADFSKIDADVVLAAVGQAFFSISVGTGIMITFGAYLPAEVSIPRAAAVIVFADTLVALSAGIAIFPIVFEFGLDPAEGAGLIFVTLPVAFAQMDGGLWIGVAFFALFTIAALTSLIATMEAIMLLLGEGLGWSRVKSGCIAGGLAWVIGLGSVLSLNLLSEFKPIGDLTLFGLVDYTTSNLMLPIGGVLLAVFAGWKVSGERVRKTLGMSVAWFAAWRFCVRYLAPVAIFLVLLGGLSR